MRAKQSLMIAILLVNFIAGCSALPLNGSVRYEPVAISVSASSTLNSKEGDFAPENVLDGDRKTAWLEGQEGVKGAKITFRFDEAVEFCGFEYIPGYAKDSESFRKKAVPYIFSIDTGVSKSIVHTFLKHRLTGLDLEEEPPLFGYPERPDFSDPMNLEPQCVLVRPVTTREVTVTLLMSMTEGDTDNGFSELRPIIRHKGKIYCGRSAMPAPWEMLAGGIDGFSFSKTVSIPVDGAIQMNPHPWASWEVRISHESRNVESSTLTPGQKELFCPYDESFRLFQTDNGLEQVSARLSFYDAAIPYGYVLRRITLGVEGGKWTFSGVSFEEDVWKE